MPIGLSPMAQMGNDVLWIKMPSPMFIGAVLFYLKYPYATGIGDFK
jgi:hypothetical protein